ncbi:MAG: hypothetical protein M0T75_08270 [Chloroflexi bacterium]|nr:hypothetical protein [Chloroflexota bacterium]
MTRRAALRRAVLAVAWLAAAVAIALGAAGIVAALDHLPGGSGRPELTWTADRAVAGDLDAASADLFALVDAVGVLGGQGRAGLAALVARDTAALDAAVAEGTSQLDAIDAAAATLRASLAAIPLRGPDRTARHSAATLARYDALVAALPAVAPLRPAWERFVAGVAPAAELTAHLLAHDTIAAGAIRAGGAGSYATAVARIAKAAAELDAARTIRDRLAAAVDVTTLDAWISRNAAYDTALSDLWNALRRSRGRVTDAVRTAAMAEQRAREQLPADARALVVILGDVARGGLNQAVIAIEEARGALLEASVAAAAGAAPPSPPPASPSAAPASPSPASTP